MATRTYCDRCGKEGPVVKLSLAKLRVGQPQHLPQETYRIIDACANCVRAIKEAFDPPPQKEHA